MLTIRKEQFAALQEVALLDFQRRQVEFLSKEYPLRAAALGQAGLQAHIERALRDARGRSIRTAGAVAIWIELRLQFGDDLERSPDRQWAYKILGHPELPDYVKLDLVRTRLTAQTGGRPVVSFNPSLN